MFEDFAMARQVVQEVDQAGGGGQCRLEVVREGLERQFREHC